MAETAGAPSSRPPTQSVPATSSKGISPTLHKGNTLSRDKEVVELVNDVARLLTEEKPAARAAQAAFRAQVTQSAEIVSKATALTDQIEETLSQAGKGRVHKLNASTEKLKQVFAETDRMYERLQALNAYVSTIHERLKVVRAAKEKKYPAHLKVF